MTGFFIAMALLLSLLSGTAQSQPPGHRIGVNPAYPVPAGETPAGIEVNSATLVENANLWNGRIVAFKGEAIGECMVRGNMAWLHLNDDAYMEKNIEEGAVLGGYNSGHAVWVSAELAKKIRFFGDFKHDGDIVRVTGSVQCGLPGARGRHGHPRLVPGDHPAGPSGASYGEYAKGHDRRFALCRRRPVIRDSADSGAPPDIIEYKKIDAP